MKLSGANIANLSRARETMRANENALDEIQLDRKVPAGIFRTLDCFRETISHLDDLIRTGTQASFNQFAKMIAASYETQYHLALVLCGAGFCQDRETGKLITKVKQEIEQALPKMLPALRQDIAPSLSQEEVQRIDQIRDSFIKKYRQPTDTGQVINSKLFPHGLTQACYMKISTSTTDEAELAIQTGSRFGQAIRSIDTNKINLDDHQFLDIAMYWPTVVADITASELEKIGQWQGLLGRHIHLQVVYDNNPNTGISVVLRPESDGLSALTQNPTTLNTVTQKIAPCLEAVLKHKLGTEALLDKTIAFDIDIDISQAARRATPNN